MDDTENSGPSGSKNNSPNRDEIASRIVNGEPFSQMGSTENLSPPWEADSRTSPQNHSSGLFVGNQLPVGGLNAVTRNGPIPISVIPPVAPVNFRSSGTRTLIGRVQEPEEDPDFYKMARDILATGGIQHRTAYLINLINRMGGKSL